VLDEPTNDLDIETLELLEARLVEYPGTLLVVSHDRRFLDNVVTSTLVFVGGGVVREYVGGYEDWVRQRPAPPRPEKPPRESATPRPKAARVRKLSFNEQRELQALPDRIAALEREQAGLQARIEAPDFYQEGAEAIATTLQQVEDVRADLDKAYAQWDALDSKS
jgi:ATP-binding cassette subfamily F protein uup